MNLLIPENKKINASNWYGPLSWLKEHTNVVGAWLVDTTSSAGDWSGLVAIRQSATDGDISIYEFYQSNVNPFGQPCYEIVFSYVDSLIMPISKEKVFSLLQYHE